MYTLEIKAAGRAAYTPKSGDSYTLTITFANNTTSKSTGTVEVVTALTITLKHTDGIEFTLTVSGSSISAFTSDSPNIPVDADQPPVPKPSGDLKPVVSAGISGTYVSEGGDEFSLAFSGGTSGTVTMNASFFGQPIRASGTYTVVGNKITITVTSSNNSFIIVGDTQTYTIIDENTIKDDDDGDILRKR